MIWFSLKYMTLFYVVEAGKKRRDEAENNHLDFLNNYPPLITGIS